MYIFDPVAGRRRRAFIRDKAGHYMRKAAYTSDIVSRDIANRLEGFRHEGLQRSSLQKLDLLQERWSPATRFLISVGAVALSFYGVNRGGLTGQLMSLLAGGCMVEALTNTSLFEHRKQLRRTRTHTAKATAGEHAQAGGQIKAEDTTKDQPARREVTGISDVPAGEPAVTGAGAQDTGFVQGATTGQATKR